MWNVLVAIVGFAVLVKFISTVSSINCRYAFFLGFVIWLRLLLAAYHEITFPPLIAGMSINALASVCVVMVAVFIMPKYLWKLKVLLPIYGFVLCIILSSALNSHVLSGIGSITKWLYLLSIALLTYHCMKKHGEATMLKLLLIPFALPIILQVLSIILGYSKQTEGDGSVSYIGGYNHEAVFSVVILTFLMILALMAKNTIRHQALFVAVAIYCLLMANYRTTLLGALPVILIFYWGYAVNSVIKRQRTVIVFAVSVFTIVLFAIIFPSVSERFADIGIVIENAGDLFKSARYYTDEEQDLFSARLYIWSQYLTEFFSAPLNNWVIGLGPDSWKNSHEKYAHNTFVSFLYEFGFVGLLIFITILWQPIKLLLLKTADTTSSRLLAAHFGFIIVNLATMPLWQIEGVILYGFILGYSWFLVSNNHVSHYRATENIEQKIT